MKGGIASLADKADRKMLQGALDLGHKQELAF